MRSTKLIWRIGMVLTAGILVATAPVAGSTASIYQNHAGSRAATRTQTADPDISRNSQSRLGRWGDTKPLVHPDQAYDNCTGEYADIYCDYIETDGNDRCFAIEVSQPNWGNYDCRNLDESFANRDGEGVLVRLYYSPNYKGAWACVNNGWYSNNLNKDVYTFNNGGSSAPGHGQEIWDNIASSYVGDGTCSNPLPEDG
jgi:hypothetical protein